MDSCTWRASLVPQTVNNLPGMQETWVQSQGRKELDTTERLTLYMYLETIITINILDISIFLQSFFLPHYYVM